MGLNPCPAPVGQLDGLEPLTTKVERGVVGLPSTLPEKEKKLSFIEGVMGGRLINMSKMKYIQI